MQITPLTPVSLSLTFFHPLSHSYPPSHSYPISLYPPSHRTLLDIFLLGLLISRMHMQRKHKSLNTNKDMMRKNINIKREAGENHFQHFHQWWHTKKRRWNIKGTKTSKGELKFNLITKKEEMKGFRFSPFLTKQVKSNAKYAHTKGF